MLAGLSGDQSEKLVGTGIPCPFESGWRDWLPALLPSYLTDKLTGQALPFGEHHADFWDWVWALQTGIRPHPLICIWPRGGGKSTSAELAGAMVGALRTRRYILYVCETLERAEDHVSNVATMLESAAIERYYPHVADRMVSKFGSPKGWRRNRLRTASGFTVDAIGLDVAARGIKLDEIRPDLMIFDDIDGEADNPAGTTKKINLITKKFLPAGSSDLAVLGVQNLIHSESIFSRLAGIAEEPADFLRERIVSGPFPAAHDLTYEEQDGRFVVTGGRPIWAGQDLAKCQQNINDWGISAFLSEAQQEVDVPDGGMFSHLTYRHCRPDEVPDLVRVAVWVDPAVTEKDSSDSHAIQVDGIASDGTLFRLWSWEQRSSPEKSLTLAIEKAIEYGALYVGVETDQGGDLWDVVYRRLVKDLQDNDTIPQGQKPPGFKEEKAGGGQGSKAARAARMLVDYERNAVVHVVGTHTLLEKALKRFPKAKPFDLVDASYWSWHDLTPQPAPRVKAHWIG